MVMFPLPPKLFMFAPAPGARVTLTDAALVTVFTELEGGDAGRVSVWLAVEPEKIVSSPGRRVAVAVRAVALFRLLTGAACTAVTATPWIFPTAVAPWVPVTSPASEPVKLPAV